MSSPDSGEYSVRSLAEILREHGLETELGTRPGRRRRTSDDPEVTGRSPRVEPAPRAPRPQAPAGQADRRAPARSSAPGQSRPPAASPSRTSTPLWTGQPESGPRPAAGLAGPATPVREPVPARAEPREAPVVRSVREPVVERAGTGEQLSTTGPVGSRADIAAAPARTGRRKGDVPPATAATATTTAKTTTATTTVTTTTAGPSTSAIPALGATRAGADHPVTGPIPVQSAAAEAVDEQPLSGRQSALAWARFVGELVVALAVGIGLYFAFTVLWELMPYVALVAAPVSVTALVAGVAAWRQKTGQGQLGVRLLAVLLLAGTVLVIAPAAGLLAG